MWKALFITIALGAGFGLMLPTGEQAAPVAAVAVTPAAGAAPQETVLERSENGHFYANAEVNGQLVRFVVDTGATGVALTEDDARRIGIPFSRDEFTIVGSGASGPVRGKAVMLDKVSLDGKEARDVRGAILEGSDISLLGQDYLGRMTVEMRGEIMRIS
jgi:aspartyl protease family protein